MRKKRHQEPENHERWLVSYADFITLMFAFFVVLYATSQQDIKKEKEFEESMKKEFKILALSVGTKGEKASDTALSLNDSKAGPRELGQAINSALEGEMSDSERNEVIESLRADTNGVRMSLLARNYFEESSIELRANSLTALTKIGRVLSKTNRKMVFEGHQSETDSKVKDDWNLAGLRANQLVKFFVKNFDMPKSQFVSVSYADTRPLVNSKDLKNNYKNNRIEILIVTKDLLL